MQLERPLSLLPDPASVRAARQHVRAVLMNAGRTELVEDATLAVSEIVANVVLHARTPCRLDVAVSDDGVTLRVRDYCPALPTQRHFSDYATTGRGLLLVGRLSADLGIDVLGDDGKVVWCVIDGVPKGDAPSLLDDEWDLSGLLDPPAGDGAPVGAVLQRVPMVLWLAGLEHQAAVLRELYLVLAAASRPDPWPDIDLQAADAALRALSEGSDRALQRADDPALPRLAPLPPGHPAELLPVPAVLDVDVTAAGSAGFGALQDALDLGQRLAAEGHLLVRPALDELVALRDWSCDQVVAQSAGQPATPWDQTTAALASNPHYRRPQWDDTVVTTSSRAVVAADDSNRIIALSAAAAELLGGTAESILGRRVTSIIPPRLREQHVAGFTRHLATGEARVLGVELDLPVLCLDGRELVRRLLIEQVQAPGGRKVYVAWFDRPATGTDVSGREGPRPRGGRPGRARPS